MTGKVSFAEENFAGGAFLLLYCSYIYRIFWKSLYCYVEKIWYNVRVCNTDVGRCRTPGHFKHQKDKLNKREVCTMSANELKPIKEGKVREIYDNGDSLIMVATDRISCFDVIL